MELLLKTTTLTEYEEKTADNGEESCESQSHRLSLLQDLAPRAPEPLGALAAEPRPGAVGYAEPRVQARVVNTLCPALTAPTVCRQPPAVSASTIRLNT